MFSKNPYLFRFKTKQRGRVRYSRPYANNPFGSALSVKRFKRSKGKYFRSR